MDERYDAAALRLARQAAAAGETVLWAGRPGRRRLPDGPTLYPATMLAVMIGTLGWHMRDDWDQPGRHWAIAGVVLGIGGTTMLALLALSLWNLRQRDRVVYAVTDRRVLILRLDGAIRHAVGLERAGEFRRLGRTVSLGGEAEAYRLGKTDLDGGLRRMELLPRLERLADAEQVMTTIRRAAGIV